MPRKEPAMFAYAAEPTVHDELERCIHGLVAEHLGVGIGDLAPEVSLVDDLAADSLDLVELALAIEQNLGVVLPRHLLDEVRTCGDLVGATLTLAEQRRRRTHRADEPIALRARLTPAAAAWVVERVLLLTPYAEESLADDALRAGPGARLELRLASRASDGALRRVREQFSRLAERGIEVRVSRDPARGRSAA
jgi:acyl carrier protein